MSQSEYIFTSPGLQPPDSIILDDSLYSGAIALSDGQVTATTFTLTQYDTPGTHVETAFNTNGGGNNEVTTLTVQIVPTGTSVTPEPSSFALLGTGLLGVAGMVRKRFA